MHSHTELLACPLHVSMFKTSFNFVCAIIAVRYSCIHVFLSSSVYEVASLTNHQFITGLSFYKHHFTYGKLSLKICESNIIIINNFNRLG